MAEIRVESGICRTFFPNAFTPNGDGNNDLFKILTDLKFQQFHLAVFNRWGQQVFESKEPSNGWDGRFHGKEQPAGEYVWNCVLMRSNVSTHMNGTMFLIR